MLAQAPAAATVATQAPAAEELDGLVGRIALYPDDLVGIILPASTNPLQIVQADRYLEKRKAGPEGADRREVGRPGQVAAELPRCRQDDEPRPRLDGGARRGGRGGHRRGDGGGAGLPPQNAIGRQPQDRRQADRRGGEGGHHDRALQSRGDLRASVQPDDRGATPATPTPTTRHPTRSTTTPTLPARLSRPASIWGAAMGAIWNGGHYGCGWGGGGNNNININRNTNINTGNINTGNVNGGQGQGGGGSTQWKSSKQPGPGQQFRRQDGAERPRRRCACRRWRRRRGQHAVEQPGRRRGRWRGRRWRGPPVGTAGSRWRRPDIDTAGRRWRGRCGSASRASPSGGSAFDGYGSSGRQTQMDSSRGASSRSSMSSGGARSAPSGGGARSGGGGGGGGRRR